MLLTPNMFKLFIVFIVFGIIGLILVIISNTVYNNYYFEIFLYVYGIIIGGIALYFMTTIHYNMLTEIYYRFFRR